jgi:hypothetical protein
LAEISRTVHENIIPIGSIIIVNVIGVDVRFIMFHSTIVICCEITTYIVGRIIISSRVHIRDLAIRKI